MGKLFSALNALFLGSVAFLGVFFNIEQRRMDNYHALYALILDRPDADWSLDQEAVDAFSNSADCEPLAFDPGAKGFGSQLFSIRCPLTDQHRFILNRLVSEKQERDRSVQVAEMAAPSTEPETTSERRFSRTRERALPAPSLSATERRSLVGALNSSSRDTRRSATAQLEANNLRDASVVSALIEELADPELLDGLNAQGRYNLIYLLNQVPDDVWTPDMIQRTRQAIDLMQERTELGISAMGDQTRRVLQELDAKITRLGG